MRALPSAAERRLPAQLEGPHPAVQQRVDGNRGGQTGGQLPVALGGHLRAGRGIQAGARRAWRSASSCGQERRRVAAAAPPARRPTPRPTCRQRCIMAERLWWSEMTQSTIVGPLGSPAGRARQPAPRESEREAARRPPWDGGRRAGWRRGAERRSSACSRAVRQHCACRRCEPSPRGGQASQATCGGGHGSAPVAGRAQARQRHSQGRLGEGTGNEERSAQHVGLGGECTRPDRGSAGIEHTGAELACRHGAKWVCALQSTGPHSLRRIEPCYVEGWAVRSRARPVRALLPCGGARSRARRAAGAPSPS